MNCKPGDLAIYVGETSPKDIGKIVTCIKFLGNQDCYGGGVEPMWLVDPPLTHTPAKKDWIRDSAPKPIRPQPDDAVDEVIQRIGTQHKEPA